MKYSFLILVLGFTCSLKAMYSEEFRFDLGDNCTGELLYGSPYSIRYRVDKDIKDICCPDDTTACHELLSMTRGNYGVFSFDKIINFLNKDGNVIFSKHTFFDHSLKEFMALKFQKLELMVKVQNCDVESKKILSRLAEAQGEKK